MHPLKIMVHVHIDLKTDKLVNEILQNSIQFYPTSLDMCILLHMYIEIHTYICIEISRN